MTGKAAFSEQEWELVREGPAAAGIVAVTASSGGSFRESWAMAKAYAEARQQHGSSELLDDLVSERPKTPRYHSAEEAQTQGLKTLRDAVSLLEQKAPDDLDGYRRFTLDLARRVAEAHREEGESNVSAAEREALDKIGDALGASPG